MNLLTQPVAAVEKKVAAGASSGMITGVVAWILVTYVPVFHHGLPGPLATFLPWVISFVASVASSWLAPHTPRPPALTVTPGKPADTGSGGL